MQARRRRVYQTIEGKKMAATYKQAGEKEANLNKILAAVKQTPMSSKDMVELLGVSPCTVRAYIRELTELRPIKYIQAGRGFAPVYATEGEAISLDRYLKITGLAEQSEQRRIERLRESNKRRDQKRMIERMNETYIDGIPQVVRDSFKQPNCNVVAFNGRVYRREAHQ